MVSVIVPIYQVEQYLPKCIESLINQTYENLELCFTDDGSTDSCAQFCDEYAMADSRIIVLHQLNKGVSAARNAGLEVARGQHIGFCDPDDWAAPEMFEALVHGMEDYNTDLSICGYQYYDEQYRLDTGRQYKEQDTEILPQKTLMDRLADMPPSIRHGVWNKLFITSLLHTQRFQEGLHSSEDVLFLTDYIRKCGCASVVHRPLYQNLVRSGSATHGGLSIQSLSDSIAVHEYMYNVAIEMYPDLKDRAQAFLLDVCTLKYTAAKKKLAGLPEAERKVMQQSISQIRHTIHSYAWRALFNREIWWKTRIAYLILR